MLLKQMRIPTFEFSYHKQMKSIYIVPMLIALVTTSCFNIEEDTNLLVHPTATISAHVKNERINATAQINVNPEVLEVGNIPTVFEFSGELAIYNTVSGNIIDVSAFSGGGLSQVYSVAADTATHEKFVVTASGTIKAYSNIGNDNDPSNDLLISTGDFYEESVFYVSDFNPVAPE